MLDKNTDARIALRVAYRFQPKETKLTKVEKTKDLLAEKAGISKSLAEKIADAIVRGRDVLRLAVQNGWPIDEDGLINGKLHLSEVTNALA
jgi:hypothetical protein